MGSIRNNISSISFWVGSLIFGFYSIIMLLAVNFFGLQVSYTTTVSSRITLAFLILIIILRSKPLRMMLTDKLVILFWGLWILRLLYDGYLQSENILSHEPSYYFFLSIFFAIIPFFGGKYIQNLKYVKNGIIYSSVIFCLIILVMFNQFIGSEVRLGVDEDSISPLVLSYTASLVIGYFLVELLLNRFKLKHLIYVVLAIPAFGLGASKGGVFAIVLSVAITLYVYKKIKLKYLFAFAMLIVFIQNASFFGMSTLTQRFESAFNDYSGQSSKKDAREVLWNQAVENIYNSPITGDFIEVKKGRIGSAYPHNIIVEAAMSTGFIGGILMIVICFITFRRALFLVKISKEYIWILVIYTQAFAQNMVSGNLYSAATWFWFMVGLVNYKYIVIKNTVINEKKGFKNKLI